jgi:hypothetical protein
MFAFAAAPLHVALPISLIGGLADTCGCRLEPQLADAGSHELFVDLTPGLRIEVPGFSDDGFGDPFTQLPGSELGVGVGQFEPPRPRSVQSPCCDHGGEAAGQPELFGDATPDRGRVHIGCELFSDLGLGEPHRLGGL